MPREGFFARVHSTGYITKLPEAEKQSLLAKTGSILQEKWPGRCGRNTALSPDPGCTQPHQP